MNVKEYIASGILEEYCLGLLSADEQEKVLQICKLYPEVKAEVTVIENTMEQMAAKKAITPNAGLREQILDLLGFTESADAFDINDLPPTTAYSNYSTWLKTLEHLIPAKPTEDFLCHVLRQDDRFAQMLVVTKLDVPEESHTDVKESFFILKGQCKCVVGEHTYMLGPGDFLDIPLYTKHNVQMVSPHVVAILQHQYIQ